MAMGGMDSEMAEAAVQFCHMIDRETDSEVTIFACRLDVSSFSLHVPL